MIKNQIAKQLNYFSQKQNVKENRALLHLTFSA